MRTFDEQELHATPALLSEDREDELLQRDILGVVAKRLLKTFQISEEKFDTVANAVAMLWMESGLSKKFRSICCAKPDKLKKRLYHKLHGKTNAERVDFILNQLGFMGTDDFLAKNLTKFKEKLLEVGIDIAVIGKTRQLIS